MARGDIGTQIPWPAGLRRDRAAQYVGVSPSKFDDWVHKGIMPKPKRQDGIVLWLRASLDSALEALPDGVKELEDTWRDV